MNENKTAAKTDQELIIYKLEKLSEQVGTGFRSVGAALDELERRLGKQERKIKKTAKRQTLQADEIEKLKKIVRDLANSDGRRYGKDVAIRKEPAYKKFEECGIGHREAMIALRDAGAIKADCQNKTTCTIQVDGKARRVILVFMDQAGGET